MGLFLPDKLVNRVLQTLVMVDDVLVHARRTIYKIEALITLVNAILAAFTHAMAETSKQLPPPDSTEGT